MIRLEDLTKVFPAQAEPAVDDLSLEIYEGEIVVLVGPSGCGKTTTMKMINRIIEPTSGRIILEGEDVTKVNPDKLRRRIGYVIQQIGLFPHMTIADNIATVPKAARLGEGPDLGPGRRAARDRRHGPAVLPRPLPEGALRRPAPAHRGGPGDGRRPAGDAHGRAVRRDRPDHPREAAGRVPAAAGRRSARPSSSSPTTSTRR